MKSSRAKEIRNKLFEKMYGAGHSDSAKKGLMETPIFKKAYRRTKQIYENASTIRR